MHSGLLDAAGSQMLPLTEVARCGADVLSLRYLPQVRNFIISDDHTEYIKESL